jgi:hypothetical protein
MRPVFKRIRRHIRKRRGCRFVMTNIYIFF